MRAVVMGAGSWGTATAKVLVDAGTDTVLWARRPELAETINAEGTPADDDAEAPKGKAPKKAA